MRNSQDSSSEQSYDLSLLEASYHSWVNSKGLKLFYADIYKEIRSSMQQPGNTLEIGSGIGVSKEYFDDFTTSDVELTPFVDRKMSAYSIELSSKGKWSNILALDVLHHLMRPLEFLESAASVLKQGGRLILVEPAATCGGTLFYRLFHHEPIAPKKIKKPYVFKPNGERGEFANMGMSVGLFERNYGDIVDRIERFGLRVLQIRYRDFFAYPLTGGYSKPQLVPVFIISRFLDLDRCLPQWILRFLALRMTIVLEKRS